MIDVMMITYNESLNLPYSLASLQGWTRKVHVIDSGSTDDTVDIARSFGAEVVHHDWPGYARQKNWGLDTLALEADWTLILDADEVITQELREVLLNIAARPVEQVHESGFYLNRLTYFLGKPIHHCGYFPSWHLRFFKRGHGRYEDRPVHEHVEIQGPLGRIARPMLHDDRRGLEHYVAKHNRYSTLEAHALYKEITEGRDQAASSSIALATRWRRWLKRNLYLRLRLAGLWRFLYMYILRLGILDGSKGFAFCRFIAMYDGLVALKLRGLRQSAMTGGGQHGLSSISEGGGLAMVEGVMPVERRDESSTPEPGKMLVQLKPEASPWTFREKLARALWLLSGRPLFRLSFHNWYRFRRVILRLFGARIGRDVSIRPTVHIEVPWMLEIEDGATVGDHAILYSLGPIRIGARAIISQYAHLCAGTHDYTDHTFRLIRLGIIIGQDVWIGADSFVGPGVEVGDLSVLGARSSAYKTLEPRQVYVGNPARAIKERILQ